MLYIILWRNNVQIASCRLRVYSILPHLNLEYSFVLPREYSKDDVLFIQKIANERELVKAKKGGAKVVYDIDDMYLYKPVYKRMVENADIVTVATESMKNKFLPNSVVIPNCLDWNGYKKESKNNSKLLSWTSYGNNAGFLNTAYDDLVKQNYELLLVTSSDYKQHFKGKCKFKNWSLETVDQNLALANSGLICLPKTDFCLVKSMHKLLKYWAIGIPCYVTPIPDYIKAVNESGADKNCLVNDWSNLKELRWDKSLRDYALQFTPDKIAPLWRQVFS